jgi:hypothetical protein
MYNLNYECLYKVEEEEEDKANRNGGQKKYQTDILSIFGMETFDEEKIMDVLDTIYTKVKNNEHIKRCMNTINANMFSHSDQDMFEYSFIIMYSYEYLYVTHPCICDLLLRGEISETNVNNLLKIIQ